MSVSVRDKDSTEQPGREVMGNLSWEARPMRKMAAIFITLVVGASSTGRIITVDDDAPADFTTIQAAIDDANDGDTIKIQPGTYSGNGNRDIDFLGKAITVTSTDPNDPNTVAQTVIDENGKIFLFQNAEDANSVLDGLTIIHGSYDDCGIYITGSAPAIRHCVLTSNATGWFETGRAIWCEAASSPTIESCLFTDNAADRGGAIYCIASTITATDCVFRNNWAIEHTGGAIRARESKIVALNCTFQENHGTGGAISLEGYPSDLSEVIVRDCVFIGNTGLGTARAGGGALTNAGYKMTVTGSLFAGNWSAEGGAILNAGETVIKNCLFVGNSAEYGGALCSMGGSVNVLNSTFAGNYSEHGNALCCSVYGLWGIPASPSAVRIRDSVVWDGPDSIAIEDDSTLLVAFCDITGTVPGYGNIDADPCFVDPGYWVDSRDPNIIVDPSHEYAAWVNGDYHVKSQGGRYDPNTQSWVQDDATSPCIDVGDPNSPLELEPFPNGGLINMGAYGGIAEASKSYFGKPICEIIVAGDINGDCVVNGLDFSLMAAHWLGRAVCPNMPSSPNPADHGEDVPVTQVLAWRASCDATSYKVYFGTTSPGQYQGQQETLIFDPGTLEYNTTYYWHIRDVTAHGPITGPTWTFKTPFRLDPATNPNPPDGTPDASRGLTLSWTAGIGAESHDVYFGQTNPPEFQINQTATIFVPGTLAEETIYYWCIDEVNSDGKTEGAIWTFTTGTGGTR